MITVIILYCDHDLADMSGKGKHVSLGVLAWIESSVCMGWLIYNHNNYFMVQVSWKRSVLGTFQVGLYHLGT